MSASEGPASIDTAELRRWLVQWFRRHVADQPDAVIDVDRPLLELGLASRQAVALVGDLESLLGRTVDPTLAWQVPTIRLIATELTGGTTRRAASARPGAPRTAEPVAVVGVGCRLPGGVQGPDDFWELLHEGRDAIGEVPDRRWEQFVAEGSAEEEVLQDAVRWGGFLDDVAGFDAEHFGVAAREAELMDPQQRLLLEVASEALHHAGLAPDALRGTATGVFVGISVSEYSRLTAADLRELDAWTATGSALSIAANRISYLLDLRGPSVAVDTACSSSLVALHQACASLRSRESDVALSGGANLLLSPTITTTFDRAGLLAADGRCKPFGADADGIVRGEGVGVVVLKRLSDAERDGDRVLAVVRGSAVNSDGRSNGLMAPNPQAQQDVLASAYAAAGVDPTRVDYVEAHGTGTSLGDPIEAGALGAVLGRGRDADRPLLIGSAKSNVGHLEAAAGITGLIKTVLALHHGTVPPSLHADVTTPHVDLDAQRLSVVTRPRELPRHSGTGVAGVSGFGFGGTNAHVVLAEHVASPAAPDADVDAGVHVLELSAATPARLRPQARELARHLGSEDVPVADLAHALRSRQGDGSARAFVAGRDRGALVDGLLSLESDDRADKHLTGCVVRTGRADHVDERPVWVFSGYGSQWAGMAARLLEEDAVFATALETAATFVLDLTDIDVVELIEDGLELADASTAQPAIFCVQVALAASWRSRGVEPAAVVGHSMGEVAAAVVAGALTLRDGATVICERSMLLAELETQNAGAMVVVDVSPDVVRDLTSDLPGVEVAVHGAPDQCTVAGPVDEIATLTGRVERQGRDTWSLPFAGAGHTAAVDPVLDRLVSALEDVRPRTPSVPMYSTVLADPRSTVARDVAYWAQNMRRQVRFVPALQAAVADGHRVFAEIAPHPIASRGIASTLADAGVDDGVVLGTLRRRTDDVVAFAAADAELRLHTELTRRVPREEGRAWVDLPRAPWRHEEFWFRPGPGRARGGDGASHEVEESPGLGTHVEVPEGGRHLWQRRLGAAGYPGVARLARAAASERGATGVGHALDLGVAPTDPDTQLLTSLSDDGRLAVHHRSGPDQAWQLLGSAVLTTGATRGGVVGEREEESAAGTSAGEDSPVDWRTLDAEEAREHVRAVVAGHVADVLGGAAVDPSRPLAELGIDSLMASRARTRIEADLAVTVPVRLLLQGASVEDLVETIVAGASGTADDGDTSARGAEAAPRPRATRAGRAGPAPRDAAERLVAATWRDVLADVPTISLREGVGVDESLTSLGATDADVLRVRAALERRLGALPQDATATPTIAAMADAVRSRVDGGPGQVVRTLRAGGDRPPLFVFHPAGGPTSVYQPLVDLLGPDQPVHGLERIDAAVTIEAKVEAYLPRLRELCPRGPYRMLGWSFGGLLAQEAARRLSEAGELVDVLALVDPVRPLPDPADADPAALLVARHRRFSEYVRQTYGAPLDLPLEELPHLDQADRLEVLRTALASADINLPPAVLEHQVTSYADTCIAEAHEPQRADVPAVLYRATEVDELGTSLDPRYRRSDRSLGWEDSVSELEVVLVPGDHLTMVERPHVDVVARHLSGLLERTVTRRP